MRPLFICFISLCIALSLIIIGNCRQLQLQSEIRVTKLTNCNITGLKWKIENVSTTYYYPKSYHTIVMNITEEIKKLKKMIVHVDRCNDQDFGCEDFQNWCLEDFCSMLNWKNQMWTSWVDVIRPPLRCPLKKNVYMAKNFTFDVNAIIRWYPESVKYRWRFNVKVLNEKDNLVMCGDFHMYVYQYRTKNK